MKSLPGYVKFGIAVHYNLVACIGHIRVGKLFLLSLLMLTLTIGYSFASSPTAIHNWEPLASITGTFDGNRYTIADLMLKRPIIHAVGCFASFRNPTSSGLNTGVGNAADPVAVMESTELAMKQKASEIAEGWDFHGETTEGTEGIRGLDEGNDFPQLYVLGLLELQAPAISNFSPSSASEGTVVTITGSGFTGVSSVRFGGIEAFSFTVNSDTEISATVAYGSSGSLELTSPAGTISESGFTFIPSATYTFNYLPIGSVEGIDGWRTVPTGSSGSGNTHQILIPGVTSASQNSVVTGHDGTRAIRFPFGGASIGSRATRINNANFSTLPVLNDEGIYIIEFEMQHPCWGAGFALGIDADANEDLAENTEVGIRLNISNCGGNRTLVLADGSSVSGTYAVGFFNQYQIVLDRAANAGAGAVSVYIKNVTAGGAWEPIVGLQNINARFDNGTGKANPSNWNAIMLRSESWDPSSLFDNISFRKVIPSTKSLVFQDTPLGGSSLETLSLSGIHLNGNLTATLSGDFEFSDGSTTATGLTDGTLNTIRFKPQAEGMRTGTLVLQGDDMQVPFSIPLSGMGFAVNLNINAGDGQSAQKGTDVAIPPRVLVQDVDNNPVAGVSVQFEVVGPNQTLVTYPFTNDRLPNYWDGELFQNPGEIGIGVLSWGFINDGSLGYGPALHVTPQAATTKDAAIAANAYFSFTLNAQSGESFDLDFLRFQVGRGINNPTSGLRGYAIRSSLDNYTTDLFAEETPDGSAIGLSQKQVSLSGFDALSTVTFRVYVYTPSGSESLNFLNWEFGSSDPSIVEGTITPTTSILTDANGLAQLSNWNLSTSPGTNKLRAQVSGLSPVIFSATGLDLPSAPRLYTESASVALRVDNDFAVFLGDENNVTSLFYQNNVGWPTQIDEAATLEILASSGESYIYVVPMGGGGTEDYGGTLNEQDITLVAGAQRAISRATLPSTVEDGYLLVQGFLSSYNNSAVTSGSYNVLLADLQNALAGASWGPAVSTGVGSGIPPNHKTTGVSALLTGRAWDFPSESAVVFRYPFPTVFSLAPELQPVPDYDGGQLFFKEPADEGGSPITNYVVEYRIAGTADAWTIATASACSSGIQPCMDVTGLDSGVTYEFRVAAENADGVGPFSNPFEMTTLEAHVWNGTLNTTGENDSNWSIALPPANAKIIIPASAPRFPEFDFDYVAGEVEIETGATLTMAPGRTLSFGSGKGATGGGKIILKSDSNGDAGIGDLSAAGTIAVNVVQERYMAGGNRAFRFFSHPYTTALPLSAISSYIDITGEGGSANGFTTTATNAPSAFRYSPLLGDDDAENDAGWVPFTNINQTIGRYEAIRILFRGSKGQGSSLLDTSYSPDPVTITWEGTINQGEQIIDLVGTDTGGGVFSDWNLVGNPFPSAIDLQQTTHSNGVQDYAIWRPRQDYEGDFSLIAGAGRGGSYLQEPLSTASAKIPSGGGFFIRAGGATATLTIPEPAKTTATALEISNVLRSDEEESSYGPNSLQIQLMADDNFLDRVLLFFGDGSASDMEVSDAPKMANPLVNLFTLSADDWALAIDRRPYLQNEGESRIPLYVMAPEYQQYTIKVADIDLEPGRTLVLYDRFTEENISLAKGQSYSFEVTDSPQSRDHRFDLIMGGEVVTSLQNLQNELQVLLMPNPAEQEVAIIFTKKDQPEATEIRIMDMQGLTLHHAKVQAQEEARIDYPVNKLRKGVYLVEVKQGAARQVKRLLVK